MSDVIKGCDNLSFTAFNRVLTTSKSHRLDESESHDEDDELLERAGVDDIEEGGSLRVGSGFVFRARFVGGWGELERSREGGPLVKEDVSESEEKMELGDPASDGLEDFSRYRRGRAFFGRRDTSLNKEVNSSAEREVGGGA